MKKKSIGIDHFDANSSEKTDLFNYDSLKLVEKPDSPLNAGFLRQTLEDCEGYLQRLPLKPPNVDQKDPQTIANMVNILTNSEAAANFANAAKDMEKEKRNALQKLEEGDPHPVYDVKSSLMQQQLLLAKKRTVHITAPGVLGHVVYPGCISFYKRDGKTYAVTEGRWWLFSIKARWTNRNVALNQDRIVMPDSQVVIWRIDPGEVGLVREQGVEILLDVGTHVFNSGIVSIVGKMSYSTTYHISHGRYNYVRVPRGKFAKVWAEVKGENQIVSVVPRLLQQGEHFVESHFFQFSGLVGVDQTYISHGSVHRVSVNKGDIAKVTHENKPRLLGEGDHVIESTQFEFFGTDSIIKSPFIVHSTITILRVVLGKVALAWQDSKPVFIAEPGLYEFDSSDFEFVSFKDAQERLIQLGAKKIVLVHTGEVAVTYDQGTLKILNHGRHLIESSTHIFYRFLSTQQKSIRLATFDADERVARKSMQSNEKHAKSNHHDSFSTENKTRSNQYSEKIAGGIDSDLTICETRDLVKVGLRADVFYSIEDPEKCINKINPDELEDLVRETAVATLTNIIRSTALNEIAQSKEISAGGKNLGLEVLRPDAQSGDSSPSPNAPMAMFFEKAHDEFLEKLHDDFKWRYGVDIANIRIESFKIMDTELSDQISKHALTTAQIENEMANLEGNSMIAVTKQRTAAQVKMINAESDADAWKTTSDAENQRMIDAAQAQAEASMIAARAQATAEAEAILTRAKAEAEAITLKAEAEAQRAELLSRTNLGQQVALLGIYSDMVIKSNVGVEKIVYLDPSVNKESPFSLGSMQNLNNDLHSLTKLGIAANGNCRN